MERLALNALVVVCMTAAGCGGSGRASADRGASAPPRRDSTLAQSENRVALRLLSENRPADAADRLRAATAADPSFGPAHNNLGQIYYRSGDLYRAAIEFQTAAKLMPDRPEPANNLGLVFESAGKLDEAAEQYGRAAAMLPDSPQFAGNLARARVRRGQGADDPVTRELLQRLVLTDDRPAWLAWARRQLALAGTTQPAADAFPEVPGGRGVESPRAVR